MSMSLRDQLIQAGLVSDKKPPKPTKQQRHEAKHRPPAVDERKLAAEKAEAAKKARDEELNRHAREKAERKARMAEVKQFVAQHKLPKIESEDCYNFVDGTRVRRLPVTAEMRAKLIGGEVAIVRCEGRYEFVPAAIGERIRERDERSVISLSSATASPAAPAADDPYKDYAVPDDLMW